MTDDLEENIKKMDLNLSLINPEIIDDYKNHLLRPMEINILPTDHKSWEAGRHGQGKLKVLTKTPIL
jgi:hypothetical protein